MSEDDNTSVQPRPTGRSRCPICGAINTHAECVTCRITITRDKYGYAIEARNRRDQVMFHRRKKVRR